ncbi:MAG: phenylalanine--tRNA ligase beta subunit-related protein, partial [Propionibacteriaceae bacterium]|nr:phenylalanine--tRNA ligase beta subunit-related protein [Propionibacteriaceae bacterium]
MADQLSLDRVVIRFAGDSGDGMQLTGDRFTADSAVFGNDISTLPNFPAEIRAPQGTLPGVSSFQLHFANYDIMTPGDRPDVLVAMNPAALKANLRDVAPGGLIIVDTADFTKRNLTKVGYATNPLEDGSLEGYQLHAFDLSTLVAPIVVRRAAAGERLVTLDDADRELHVEDLLITDSAGGHGARILGLGGVMGGADTEVTDATTDVLIEAAHFDPASVARTAR